MKRLAVLLACALCVTSLYGCGGSGGDKGGDKKEGTSDTKQEEKDDGTQENSQEADAELDGLDPITLKFASIGPESGTTQADGEAKFIEYVEEASGGKIKVDHYPNGALGGDTEMLEGCAMNTIQICNPAISVLTTYDEKFGILDMPFLFDDYESELKAVNEGKLGDEFDKMLEGTGIRIGDTYYFGGYRGLSNSVRPVESPEDMKGLKIRVMESPVYITAFTLMGANPTPMSFSELFTALQNKTVDGQDNDPSLTYTSQYYEVQKYYSNLEHTISIGCLAMSDEWYSGLPDAYKKIIDEGIKQQSELVTKKSFEMYESYLKQLEDAGMEVTKITDENRTKFKEAVEPMYDEYKEKLGNEIFDMAQEFNK